MQRKGITEEDWGVITRATPTDRNGLKYPDGREHPGDRRPCGTAGRDQVAGLCQRRSQFAVMNPDLATRAVATRGRTR